MVTKIEAPKMTQDLIEYMQDLYHYNETISDLNTCYGGMTKTVSTYEYGSDIEIANLERIAKNNEFMKTRQDQMTKAAELAKIMVEHFKNGMGQKYADYKKDLYEYKKETNQI